MGTDAAVGDGTSVGITASAGVTAVGWINGWHALSSNATNSNGVDKRLMRTILILLSVVIDRC
jgi:hypothetical protein